jgi:hypothetical protein
MFRTFFAHLRTTITNMDIYLNDHVMDRDMKVTLAEFKKTVENYRSEQKNGGKSTVRVSADVLADCEEVLITLGISVSQFVADCTELAIIMGERPREYSRRADKVDAVRVIATSGIEWNPKSQNKQRDYMMASMAAKLESLLVAKYRTQLIKTCPGVAVMRKELSKYFHEIAKGNMVLATGDQPSIAKPVSKKTWFFADMIEVDEQPADTTQYDAKAMEVKLTSSHNNFEGRKDDKITSFLTPLIKCPYLACQEEGVKKGTLETSAYHLIGALSRVRRFVARTDLSASLHSHTHTLTQMAAMGKARQEHRAKNDGSRFDPTKLNFPDLVRREHAETKDMKEFVSTHLPPQSDLDDAGSTPSR